jgi:hypothetical protein
VRTPPTDFAKRQKIERNMENIERDPDGDDKPSFLSDMLRAFRGLHAGIEGKKDQHGSEKTKPGETQETPLFIRCAAISADVSVTPITVKPDEVARWIASLTLLLLCATVFFTFKQWQTMNRTYTEIQAQTASAQCTAKAAQEQATLMRQQLVGTQAADVNLDSLSLSDTMQLHLTAMNNGHVTAQDVHITVDVSQRKIGDDSPIGPIFHFEPSVSDIPAGRGFGANWDLPWHLTHHEREQGNYFAPDWPGTRTFVIRVKATFKNGFEDKTIYRSVCKRWLPGYLITSKDAPPTGGGGMTYDCSDFREQIKLILEQEKAAKKGAPRP